MHEMNALKRRKKLIKACLFCRKRKLRCDRARPCCKNCELRGEECVYTTAVSSDTTLVKRVEELEAKLAQIQNGASDPVKITTPISILPCRSSMGDPPPKTSPLHSQTEITSQDCPNPLRNLHYLQCKSSGRRIQYGPTSMKTLMNRSIDGFVQKYRQIWNKVKLERNKWKQKTNARYSRELSIAEEPYATEASTLIQEITHILPSCDKITQVIENFFEADIYNEISGILDKTKVLNDFFISFGRCSDLSVKGERDVINLTYGSKRNYFKIGVILAILNLDYYKSTIPLQIERFFAYLAGISTCKVFYVERAQFLAMVLYYRSIFYTCGDDSHLYILTNAITMTGTALGLQFGVRELYRGQENVVGSFESIENLWLWILLWDLTIAFNIGKPLAIGPLLFSYDDPFFEDYSNTFEGKLKRLLKITRPMIDSLYDKASTPNLQLYCDLIIDYLESEFPAIEIFTKLDTISEIPLHQIRLLTLALGLLCTFYCLRFFVFDEKTRALKGQILQCVLTSLTVVANCTTHCYYLDKMKYPETVLPGYTEAPPYMSLSISLSNNLYARSYSTFSAVLYYCLTLFETGKYLTGKEPHFEWSTKSLRYNYGEDVSIISSFKMYCELSDKWFSVDNGYLSAIMRRMYSFVIIMALATVYRKILEKAIESRVSSEATWLAHLKNEIYHDKVVEETKETELNNVVASNVWNKEQNYDNTTNSNAIAETLSDEFWSSYNLGWDRLLSENIDIFGDYTNNDDNSAT